MAVTRAALAPSGPAWAPSSGRPASQSSHSFAPMAAWLFWGLWAVANLTKFADVSPSMDVAWPPVFAGHFPAALAGACSGWAPAGSAPVTFESYLSVSIP